MVCCNTERPNGYVKIRLDNTKEHKLGLKVMHNPDHSQKKGVIIKEVTAGGQAEGTVCEAGQIITHVR